MLSSEKKPEQKDLKTAFEENQINRINESNAYLSIQNAVDATIPSLLITKAFDVSEINKLSKPRQQSIDKTGNVFSESLKTVKGSFFVIESNVSEFITPDNKHDLLYTDHESKRKRSSHLIKKHLDSNSPLVEINDSGSDWEQEFISTKYIKSKVKSNQRKRKTSNVNDNNKSNTAVNDFRESSQLNPNPTSLKDNEIITDEKNEKSERRKILLRTVRKKLIEGISSASEKDDESCSDWEQEYYSRCMNNNSTNIKKGGESSSNKNKLLSVSLHQKANPTSNNETVQVSILENILSTVDYSNNHLQGKVQTNYQSSKTDLNKSKDDTVKKKEVQNIYSIFKKSVEKRKFVEDEDERIFNEDLFICNICNKVFNTKYTHYYHTIYSACFGQRKKEKTQFQCDICGALFKSIGKLEDHKNSHINARPHKCFDCDKQFNSKGARLMHHKNMHQNIKTRHLCCYCGMITQSSKHLVAHEETHRLPEGVEIPKPFKCLQCGREYISQFALTKHKKEHRLKKCPNCSEGFQTYGLVRKHLENVHGIVKVYKCEICNMTFKSTEGLRCHATAHSTVLSFFCEICDKGFKQKHHIEQHMITHSDERPISCPECGESYKRKTHLKQHLASFHGSGKKR